MNHNSTRRRVADVMLDNGYFSRPFDVISATRIVDDEYVAIIWWADLREASVHSLNGTVLHTGDYFSHPDMVIALQNARTAYLRRAAERSLAASS